VNFSSQRLDSTANGTLRREVGKIKILLTATNRWPSSARLLIELSRVGHIVSIVCPARHPSGKLRVAHGTFLYTALTPLTSIVDAIAAVRPDIVIPCDDLAVRHLHQLYASRRALQSEVDIPTLIEDSLGPSESYATVDSRYLLLKLSREEQILTPETSSLDSLDGLQSRSRDHPFPWVLKSDGTTGGIGVKIAQNLEEARAYYGDLKRSMGVLRFFKYLTVDRDLILERQWWQSLRHAHSRAIIAQTFIRGIAANCAVVCWKGEVLAGVGCEAVSTETPVGPATVVRLIDHAEMMVAARRLARRLSLSGFFGLDFVIEEGSGDTYLIEMNPRCTPPSHLRLGPGRDMVGALSAQLTGTPLRDPVSVAQNDLIAYFPQASLRNSEYLSKSFHDLPTTEPELIEELGRPSPRTGIINISIDAVRLQSVFSRLAHRLKKNSRSAGR
jgi:hypothetical protein